MKIAQVSSTPPFAWATGGCAKVAYDISRVLSKNHQVAMATTDLFEPDNRFKIKNNPEILDGIKMYRFKVINNHLAWKSINYIL